MPEHEVCTHTKQQQWRVNTEGMGSVWPQSVFVLTVHAPLQSHIRILDVRSPEQCGSHK